MPVRHDLPLPDLGLTPDQASARFAALQKKLVPLWKSIARFNDEEQTIVVVPSISVDADMGSAEMQAYEERFLFLLLLLRQPGARMVYVTSQPVQPDVIDYVLAHLSGVIPSHARRRLHLVSPLDGSPRPLSRKLLERPALLERIRALVADPDRAHLVPFNTTLLERDLALRLGIPMYGADPRFFPLGTKTGCRRLFAEEGVPHPAGVEDVRSVADLAAAIARIRADRPGVAQVVVKHNDGVSGEGNAIVDLAGLPDPGADAEEAGIEARIRTMGLENKAASIDVYLERLERQGGIVEERIRGDELRSPSVQLRVTPLGDIEVLSTHDQLLGGASGQSYLGCVFPADPGYAAAITREAEKIGARLAREGVLGRFALDFVVVRSQGGPWRPYAIEINLRKGGTTHPFLTLQFLTGGSYDPERATFATPGGRVKAFVASDHVESPRYRSLTSNDVFDQLLRRRLHFDPSRQTGVVLHMMSALGECGRLGLTAVADSPAEAEALYREAVSAIDDAAAAALAPRPLPGA